MSPALFAAEVQRDISARIAEGERGQCHDDDVPVPNAAEVAAADALDAKRYRWLRAEMGAGGRADAYILPPGSEDWGGVRTIRTGETLDDVIDEAIRAAR